MQLWLYNNQHQPNANAALKWLITRNRQWLSDQERRAFLHSKHLLSKRTESVYGKVLCRQAIEKHSGIPATSIRFVKTALGKPEVTPPNKKSTLISSQFNLSHSHHLIGCAVERCHSLGIDIEYLPRNNRLLPIAERYFHPQETQSIKKIRNQERQSFYFFLLWTLKEATIKALGETIGSMSLDEIPFEIHKQKITALFKNRLACQWQYQVFQPHKDFLIATACAYKPFQQPATTTELFLPDHLPHTPAWKKLSTKLIQPICNS